MRRFKDIRDLQPDDMVRIDGGDEVVDRVERSPDGHHWRVHLVGCARARIFPPTARFTILNSTGAVT